MDIVGPIVVDAVFSAEFGFSDESHIRHKKARTKAESGGRNTLHLS